MAPGSRVVEAGTGSGGLTLALARAVGAGGQLYSYEIRSDILRLAERNLEALGLTANVSFKLRDIRDGFDETEVDALFLDVRRPWAYLTQVVGALKDSGFFGAIVPTTNQVSWLLAEMGRLPFVSVEVLEMLQRRYKPVPARLRPEDRMVGHTGFLIFARKVSTGEPDMPVAYDEPQLKPQGAEFQEDEEDDYACQD